TRHTLASPRIGRQYFAGIRSPAQIATCILTPATASIAGKCISMVLTGTFQIWGSPPKPRSLAGSRLCMKRPFGWRSMGLELAIEAERSAPDRRQAENEKSLN